MLPDSQTDVWVGRARLGGDGEGGLVEGDVEAVAAVLDAEAHGGQSGR